VYVVKDDTADDISEMNNVKVFLSADDHFAVVAGDSSGVPAAVITGGHTCCSMRGGGEV